MTNEEARVSGNRGPFCLRIGRAQCDDDPPRSLHAQAVRPFLRDEADRRAGREFGGDQAVEVRIGLIPDSLFEVRALFRQRTGSRGLENERG